MQLKTYTPRSISLDVEMVAALRRQSQVQLDHAAEWAEACAGGDHVFAREDRAT